MSSTRNVTAVGNDDDDHLKRSLDSYNKKTMRRSEQNINGNTTSSTSSLAVERDLSSKRMESLRKIQQFATSQRQLKSSDSINLGGEMNTITDDSHNQDKDDIELAEQGQSPKQLEIKKKCCASFRLPVCCRKNRTVLRIGIMAVAVIVMVVVFVLQRQ